MVNNLLDFYFYFLFLGCLVFWRQVMVGDRGNIFVRVRG